MTINNKPLKPLKPWRSLDEQLQILSDRGMQIDDWETARNYLEKLGYYRLSGYWYPLRSINSKASKEKGYAVRDDNFIDDSHFKDVIDLYIFDKKLRLMALDALERIEMAIRVDVAHTLGERDPLAHENPNCLHGNFSRKKIKNGTNQGITAHQI